MASEQNVKVAVRVRPFNSREKEENATLVVKMQGATTILCDPSKPDKEPRQFHFDYSYWSNDGFKTDANGYLSPDATSSQGTEFCDQKKIFNDLGVGILENAWAGYNCSMFAYGQTGSGKSFSVVGYRANQGIVPLFCQRLFKEIEEKKADPKNEAEFQVTCSMLEIYNEKATDLLNVKGKKTANLKIRHHASHGFYAEGLSRIPAPSYTKIEQLMESGITNRTIASTNMNATSSRAHTIFGINFSQKFKNEKGQITEKTAIINIVDLAGSERAGKTGTSGDRFKEGTMINQSLFSLGECIAAVAKNSSSRVQIHVPFRNSVLTRLLQSALGGNSKTIMIAAISPAHTNYEESLSTLKYADRAKQIKTRATINEKDTASLIRQLREENEKYKKQLEKDGQGASQEEIDEYMSILKENKRKMAEMEQSYEERLKEADEKANKIANSMIEIESKKKKVPHIYNLNMDPQLTGHIFFFFETTPIVIGKADTEGYSGIQLLGPSIIDKHAIVDKVNGRVTLTPAADNARLLLNGSQITETVDLHHNDRLLFGTTQYFVFVNPVERDESGKSYTVVTFEIAQEEIGQKSGIADIDSDDRLLREDLLEMLPAVDEVNAISEELERKKKFTIKILPPMSCGDLDGRSQVNVMVVDLKSGIQWFWNRQKFFNRKYIIQEIYQNFVNGEEWEVTDEQDPFYDDPTAPYLIGTAPVYLGALAYNADYAIQTDVIDYNVKKVGILDVKLASCNSTGREYQDDDDECYKEPEELIGESLHFKIKIIRAQGLPNKFTDIFSQFQLLYEKQSNQTDTIANTINPEWNYTAMFSYPVATKQMIDYLKVKRLFVQIWGSHKLSTNKNVINKDAMNKPDKNKESQSDQSNFNVEQAKLMLEVQIMRKKYAKVNAQLDGFRRMIEMAESLSKKKLSVRLIKMIYESSNAEQIKTNLDLIQEEKDDSDDEDEQETVLSKMPPVSSDKKMPPVSSDIKMPPVSSDKKMPLVSSDIKMPPVSSDKKMPPASSDKKMTLEEGKKNLSKANNPTKSSSSSQTCNVL